MAAGQQAEPQVGESTDPVRGLRIDAVTAAPGPHAGADPSHIIGIPPLAGLAAKVALFGAGTDVGCGWPAALGVATTIVWLAHHARVPTPAEPAAAPLTVFGEWAALGALRRRVPEPVPRRVQHGAPASHRRVREGNQARVPRRARGAARSIVTSQSRQVIQT